MRELLPTLSATCANVCQLMLFVLQQATAPPPLRTILSPLLPVGCTCSNVSRRAAHCIARPQRERGGEKKKRGPGSTGLDEIARQYARCACLYIVNLVRFVDDPTMQPLMCACVRTLSHTKTTHVSTKLWHVVPTQLCMCACMRPRTQAKQ